jgi:hypothetical protein
VGATFLERPEIMVFIIRSAFLQLSYYCAAIGVHDSPHSPFYLRPSLKKTPGELLKAIPTIAERIETGLRITREDVHK